MNHVVIVFFSRLRSKARLMLALALILAGGSLPAAPAVTMSIQADKPTHAISPLLYGVFFEDINYAADGGLYGELIQNRSFEFKGGDALFGWSLVKAGEARAAVSVESERPVNHNNPHYLRIQIGNLGDALGIANSGFGGIPLVKGSNYNFSIWARSLDSYDGSLNIRLQNSKGEPLGTARIVGINPEWARYNSVLKPTGTDTNAQLVILAGAPGTLDLDMVSLFPAHTFKGHPNGLRADLAQFVADLKPSFVRFPGGCIVEGKDLANRYRWKDTVGDVAERKANWNRWQIAMSDALAPQYYQSYGLGFFEYFQYCEDIGAEPLPVLNCGMSCQFMDKQFVPVDRLDPYIQDALDLVEFANGPVDSLWGSQRAAMGHPEPFNMKMVGIGNEQWGEDYFVRYEKFAAVLKARHPEIKIISSAGPGPDDQWFKMAWPRLRQLNADLVDEHYYRPPSWFLNNVNRYDDYDRNGPKVFAGEYAAHIPARRNTLDAALAEAAFMTGLERNSDVVTMASYAPLLAKMGYTQWPIDLIWFDNTRIYGSPSYYVQKLFSANRGDEVLSIQLTNSRPPQPPSGAIVLTTYHTEAEFKDVRVTKGSKTLFASDFSADDHDWKTDGGNWVAKDGKYRQSDVETVASAVVGDFNWSDYTVTLRARKLSGSEGFIIGVRRARDGSQVQWNLGGWGNRQHGIQNLTGGNDAIVQQVPGVIEADRWYDIKLELKGALLNCYLDGALVQTANVPSPATPDFFATVSRDKKAEKIIIKAVNPTSMPADALVRLTGVSRIGSKGEAIMLSGLSPGDENSFEKPLRVAPVTNSISGIKPEFHYKFKPYSVTVLKIDAEK